jgi:hypothetical protein
MVEWMYRSTYSWPSSLVKRWVVSLTSQPLYSRGKKTPVPIGTGNWGGSQIRPRRCGRLCLNKSTPVGIRTRYLSSKSGKIHMCDRVTAHVVSSRLPTVAAQVRARIRLCGVCGEQSYTGECLLRVLRFSYQFSIHQILHTHSAAGTMGQLVTDVPSGLSLTPPHGT